MLCYFLILAQRLTRCITPFYSTACSVRVEWMGWLMNGLPHISLQEESEVVNDVSYASVDIFCGVPQGSVLVPPLFIVYNLSVCGLAMEGEVDIHQFSDDTQYKIEFPLSLDAAHWKNVLATLSQSATQTETLFRQNLIKIDMEKSVFFYVTSAMSSSKLQPLPLQVGDSFLQPSSTALSLGVTFDATMAMAPHVRITCMKAIFQLRRLGEILLCIQVTFKNKFHLILTLSARWRFPLNLLYRSFARHFGSLSMTLSEPASKEDHAIDGSLNFEGKLVKCLAIHVFCE